MRTLMALALATLVGAQAVRAQEGPRWRRGEEPTRPRPTLFHSTQSANLPTAETLGAGEWLFEISHRFVPSIGTDDALFGLDGPVRLRLGLAYALSDRAMVGLIRSNFQDNLEWNAKVRLLERDSETLPLMVALAGGVALNTDGVPDRDATDSRNLQYFGQLVLNALVGDKLALGVVPWVLRNPDIEAPEPETTAGVGFYGQVYVSEQVSLLAEWNASEARGDLVHDAGALGIELETGGHFFKIVVTNSIRLNQAQYLAGAFSPFEPGEWRLGFNITRLLTL